MLAACTEGASWQLSREIWAVIDLSEVTKRIQGFGTSLRISSDQAIICHRQTGGPNAYTKYIFCSPFPPTFSGSSDEYFTSMNISTLSLHAPLKVSSQLGIRPEPLCHLHRGCTSALLPAPAARTLSKRGSEQLGCSGIAELGH